MDEGHCTGNKRSLPICRLRIHLCARCLAEHSSCQGVNSVMAQRRRRTHQVPSTSVSLQRTRNVDSDGTAATHDASLSTTHSLVSRVRL